MPRLTLEDAILKGAREFGLDWTQDQFFDDNTDPGAACLLGAAALGCDVALPEKVDAVGYDEGGNYHAVDKIVFDVLAGSDAGKRLLIGVIPNFNDNGVRYALEEEISENGNPRPYHKDFTDGYAYDDAYNEWELMVDEMLAGLDFEDLVRLARGAGYGDALDAVVCEIGDGE